jgi:transposase InsO family protein
VVKYLKGRYSVSVKNACRCVRLHRSAWYYQAHPDLQTELRQRVRKIAHARVRFGYRRILMLLRREGWDLGKNRLYRVYREEGWVYVRNGRGAMCPRPTAKKDARQLGPTMSGAWTSWPISLRMGARSGR